MSSIHFITISPNLSWSTESLAQNLQHVATNTTPQTAGGNWFTFTLILFILVLKMQKS